MIALEDIRAAIHNQTALSEIDAVDDQFRLINSKNLKIIDINHIACGIDTLEIFPLDFGPGRDHALLREPSVGVAEDLINPATGHAADNSVNQFILGTARVCTPIKCNQDRIGKHCAKSRTFTGGNGRTLNRIAGSRKHILLTKPGGIT